MTESAVLAHFANERLADLVNRLAAEASAAVRISFQQARARLQLPPVLLQTDRTYRLPGRFTCPECQGRTLVEICEWGTTTGIPTSGGFTIHCQAEEEELMDSVAEDRDPAWSHNHWQDQGWMRLYSDVGRWLARNVRVAPQGARNDR